MNLEKHGNSKYGICRTPHPRFTQDKGIEPSHSHTVVLTKLYHTMSYHTMVLTKLYHTKYDSYTRLPYLSQNIKTDNLIIRIAYVIENGRDTKNEIYWLNVTT